MIQQNKINNYINKLLIVFLIIQPIFDIKFFYNSISTLIRVIIIFAFFAYYFLLSKNKYKYYLIIYPILIAIYFIFHHINALNFTSLVPGNFNYSILKEALYFVKMISPFLLIYSLYKSNISKYDTLNIIKTLVLIIGLTIIISNLFGFSYGSYSDTTIKANFFEWFNPKSTYTYQALASKGLFEFGNQTSAILIMFLPFSIYACFNCKKLINWICLITNILSLILLCTRVAVLGILLVFAYSIFALMFISFIEKKKLNIKSYTPFLLTLLVYIALLPFNPMFDRINQREAIEASASASINTVENIITEDMNNTAISNTILENENNSSYTDPVINTQDSLEIVPTRDTTDSKVTFIENNYKNKQLHEQFLFINYPYEYDVDFWYDLLQKDVSLIMNYRYIETSMVKRVVEVNNNPLDKWFGITNTRLQNLFNIERDFVVQYYALGIIGLLLVFAPYFILLIGFVYITISSKLTNLDRINSLSVITIPFIFAISYFSGNLFNSLSFTIYFTLLFILLFKKADT